MVYDEKCPHEWDAVYVAEREEPILYVCELCRSRLDELPSDA